MTEHESFKPGRPSRISIRERLTLRDELMLAILPTTVVLLVFAVIEQVSQQRLLFASLASSAFLIYLDPEHGTNRVRTLAASQVCASLVGFVSFELVGPAYAAGAVAMIAITAIMIVFDIVHPPATATALAFAFRTGDERNLVLFVLAVGLVVVLVAMQAMTLAVLARLRR